MSANPAPVAPAEKQSCLDLGLAPVAPPTPDAPPPSKAGAAPTSPLFGLLYKGHHGQPAVALRLKSAAPSRADAIEADAALAAVSWLQQYSGIAEEDTVARTQYVAPQVHEFGLHLQVQLARQLLGAVALYLMVRDGLYQGLIDSMGRPRYSSAREFMDAFRVAYGLSRERDQVSRSQAAAALWVAIVEARLPHPPVLSRLYGLLTVGSLETALWLYGTVVQEAGGQAPSWASLDAAVFGWRDAGDESGGKKDRRKFLDTLLVDSRALQRAALQPEPDLEAMRVGIAKFVAMLEARCKPAKKKARQAESAAAASRAQLKPCPVSLTQEGAVLALDASSAGAEVVDVFTRIAPASGWVLSRPKVWHCTLPKRASVTVAKRAQLGEWVTRVLERLGYQGPPRLRAA
ncbi:MAG: hypothetical protein PSV13_19830 [Lacunisphaera sp.]|nr:hypothetical protein [Lacunisphaera sp.]